jgi:hypothetical protein
MREFNVEAKCPKCGHDIVTAYYHPDYRQDTRYSSLSEAGATEYIERDCQRCRFRWAEAVLGNAPDGRFRAA